MRPARYQAALSRESLAEVDFRPLLTGPPKHIARYRTALLRITFEALRLRQAEASNLTWSAARWLTDPTVLMCLGGPASSRSRCAAQDEPRL